MPQHQLNQGAVLSTRQLSPKALWCQHDTFVPRGHPKTRLELAISNSRRPRKNCTYTDLGTGQTRTDSMSPSTRTLGLRTGMELTGCGSLLGFHFSAFLSLFKNSWLNLAQNRNQNLPRGCLCFANVPVTAILLLGLGCKPFPLLIKWW